MAKVLKNYPKKPQNPENKAGDGLRPLRTRGRNPPTSETTRRPEKPLVSRRCPRPTAEPGAHATAPAEAQGREASGTRRTDRHGARGTEGGVRGTAAQPGPARVCGPPAGPTGPRAGEGAGPGPRQGSGHGPGARGRSWAASPGLLQRSAQLMTPWPAARREQRHSFLTGGTRQVTSPQGPRH